MKGDFSLDMSKTYIYEGDEYILTGRIAEATVDNTTNHRPKRSTRANTVTQNTDSVNNIVVEIKPAPINLNSSNRPTHNINLGCKWVKYIELFEVYNVLQDDNLEEY